MSLRKRSAIRFILSVLIASVLLQLQAAIAIEFKVLHTFGIQVHDGDYPAGLAIDSTGNLYGTAAGGGNRSGCSGAGCGTVFKLSPKGDGSWSESVLYAFTGGSDGSSPRAQLIIDAAGNLYGTTAFGGVTTGYCATIGCGVVFKVSPNTNGTWTESVLYQFTGDSDGAFPYAGLVFDNAGNLYGTTLEGGIDSKGVVFELSPNLDGTWTETVLYRFTGVPDGAEPYEDLTFGADGRLYGTTLIGGDRDCESVVGCGVVFRLTPHGDGSWAEDIIHTFDQKHGAYPVGSLTLDSQGSIYGAAQVAENGVNGLIYQLTPNSDGTWTETILHAFTSPGDGAFPDTGVTFDGGGSLYGTTATGGRPECDGGCGAVFKLVPDLAGKWKETMLYGLKGQRGGNIYHGSLVLDQAGNVYGNTGNCASRCQGIAFEISSP